MNAIVKNYNISDIKIKKDIKLCLVSDFHFSNKLDDLRFNKVLENIKNNKPDYICISGDFIDSSNVLEDKKVYDKSINYLKSLAEISKVIFTLGNHDICKIKNKKITYYLNDNWIKDICKIKNVIFLNNDIYEDNFIRFIGYAAYFKYYKKFNEDEKLLIKDFNKKIPNIKDDKFNMLLSHSPVRILSYKSLNNINALKNVNVILSGHMHNGLTPNFIDKIWKSNRGLVSPHRYFFPNNARGIKRKEINNHDIFLIISGGVTKVHSLAPKMLHFLNGFYKPEVVYIKLGNN